jgi:ferredoxin-NADP reductase
MKVKFHHSEPTAQNIRTFWFKSEYTVRYIAGQFIELYLPHKDPDKRGIRHWFTLSSSPTEELLSITTKFDEKKQSTFKQTLKKLKPNTELNMVEPMGDFVLPKDPYIPLVFVAKGIGCTPYRSIIKYTQDQNEVRDITLIYGASSDEEIAFKEIFNKLGDRFIKVVGERLTAQKILELAPKNPAQYIYLSGPEPSIEKLNEDLKSMGIDERKIRTDFFLNYAEI